jgi:phytoene dehydrogenase-like protein
VGDATDAILGQLERFVPGTRDRIVGIRIRNPAQCVRKAARIAESLWSRS